MAPPADAPLAFHAHDQDLAVAGAAPSATALSGCSKKRKAAGDDEDHAQTPAATRPRISTPAPENNHGGTEAQPIVVTEDDEEYDSANSVVRQQPAMQPGLTCPEPEPDSPAPPLPACGEKKKKEYPWFCFSTWDPTDGGRYELLSTYLPPPFLNADEEDARRSAAAVASSPLYTSSAADAFWGTPDGFWTAY